ncbi:MAG: DNA-processing protein DprA, partial [Gammaproteobacteria bacterium]|nr:DNA-processing protein DprA [Gammaproteobacteria bacterium]
QAALKAAGVPAAALRRLARPDRAILADDLAWTEAQGHHLIGWGDAAYPSLLAAIDDPPVALFVTGDAALLDTPQIALVGSRNPSGTGCDIAAEFAAFLSAAGYTITSGLAMGIDAAAHAGALDVGGKTLAVLGTGPDRIYPKRNAAVRERIAQNGALASEFPPGTPPLAEHFPRRNRLISGLSRATVVIEAALGSGSLITARLAAEQGREVFAVPGSIRSPLARGCHELIRDGAGLVERPSDILEALGTASAAPQPVASDGENGATGTDPDYRILLDVLGFHPVTADTLGARTGLTSQALSSMLLILELQGEIEALPGSRYVRRKR